jgi:succinate dehydrogenase/fumarate reductase cytochrome b subunit
MSYGNMGVWVGWGGVIAFRLSCGRNDATVEMFVLHDATGMLLTSSSSCQHSLDAMLSTPSFFQHGLDAMLLTSSSSVQHSLDTMFVASNMLLMQRSQLL